MVECRSEPLLGGYLTAFQAAEKRARYERKLSLSYIGGVHKMLRYEDRCIVWSCDLSDQESMRREAALMQWAGVTHIARSIHYESIYLLIALHHVRTPI